MMRRILGIDPGTTESGYVLLDCLEGKLLEAGVLDNGALLERIGALIGARTEYMLDFSGKGKTVKPLDRNSELTLAIEWIQNMGMPAGEELFRTCMWVGRFVEAAVGSASVLLIPRGKVKLHHCGSTSAGDANVSQALRDKYGGKGVKAAPGFFFGVSKHAWQAAAVALLVYEGNDQAVAHRFQALKNSPTNLSPVCSECPGRCCSFKLLRMTSVVLLPEEAVLPRFKSHVLWKLPEGSLKERIPYLSLQPHCVFRDPKGKCRIYKHRPNACRNWVCYNEEEVMKEVERNRPTHRRLLNRWKVLPGQKYGLKRHHD